MFFFAVSPPKNTPTSTLKSEVSANPLASMAISVKDLQSVQLRKTEKVGKTMSAPIAGEISSISNVVNLHGNGKTILIFVVCLFLLPVYTKYLLLMYILSYYIFSPQVFLPVAEVILLLMLLREDLKTLNMT